MAKRILAGYSLIRSYLGVILILIAGFLGNKIFRKTTLNDGL